MSNYKITVNGVTYDVTVEGGNSGLFSAPMMSAPASFAPSFSAPAAGGVNVEAQVIGKIFKVIAKVGDAVSAGDEIVILDSMKMEIPVVSPADGTVASINVKEGDAVEVGDVIATLN